MFRSDPEHTQRPVIDWKNWLILAWVLAVSGLYARMVVIERGGKVRALLGPGRSAETARITSDRTPDADVTRMTR